MRGWWQEISGLVLPATCAGCGAARALLCGPCRRVLGGGRARRVRPVPEPEGLPAVFAAADYADQARAVLLAHKERGALALAGPLGSALAANVRAALAVGAVGDRWPEAGAVLSLVPVPSARAAVARRGHDPGRRIALAAAGALRRDGLAVRVRSVLRQRRGVTDQSGLTAERRLANLSGALAAVPRGLCEGEPVVLVDDLITTGASLAEAARAVRAAGGVVRGAAVVAAPRALRSAAHLRERPRDTRR